MLGEFESDPAKKKGTTLNEFERIQFMLNKRNQEQVKDKIEDSKFKKMVSLQPKSDIRKKKD